MSKRSLKRAAGVAKAAVADFSGKAEVAIKAAAVKGDKVVTKVAQQAASALLVKAPQQIATAQVAAGGAIDRATKYLNDNRDNIARAGIGAVTGVLSTIALGVNKSALVLSAAAGALGAAVSQRFLKK